MRTWWKVPSRATWFIQVSLIRTRLHSSRMRTARALTVSTSMLCAGVCVCSRAGCLLWGLYLVPGGVSAPRGVSALGGCTWSRGVSALGGCTWSRRGVPGQVLSPVDRHTPVNILPCPKLRLRAVIMTHAHRQTETDTDTDTDLHTLTSKLLELVSISDFVYERVLSQVKYSLSFFETCFCRFYCFVLPFHSYTYNYHQSSCRLFQLMVLFAHL